MTVLTLGYYPVDSTKAFDDVAIRPVPDLQATIDEVADSGRVLRGWYYARELERVFALPKTHEIVITGDADARAEFLAQCFGFFTGMRMSTTEAGFLDATPIKPRPLGDISTGGRSLERAMSAANRFWLDHEREPKAAKTLSAAIHSWMLSQYPKHLSFERFNYLYIAIDACYRTLRIKDPQAPDCKTHGQRLRHLSQRLQCVTPVWIDDVVKTRNNALHEGLFFDEPLGFRVFGHDGTHHDRGIPLEIEKLVSRFIVALLGVQDSRYIGSAVNDRMKQSLDPVR